MKQNMYEGTGALLRFIFRRDKVRLAIWIIGLVCFAIIFVPVFEELIANEESSLMFSVMMENPAMVAIVGPVYGIDNYHTGAMYANMMLLFCALFTGVMNIFLITRHTRQDEEQGRMEVIRSLPVGRLANLTSALIAAAIANALVALLSGIGLYAMRGTGMDINGCMLAGAVMGVTGLFFAAGSAVFCQLSANNRTAMGMSWMLLLGMYMLRAVGDTGVDALGYVSPLGLVLKTETFVTNKWYPIVIVLILAAAVAALALALCQKRDLGSGLVAERPGRRHGAAMLKSPYGLALKLLRSTLITWSIVIFVLAAMYGSVFGDMEGFIDSNDMIKAIFSGSENASVTLLEQFIVKLMAIMSMIGAIPAMSIVNRIYAEEKNGYSEHILGKSVSRSAQMISYLIPALGLSVVLQFMTALGFWSVGSAVFDGTPALDVFIRAALAYLPAIWACMGINAALVAFLPGKGFITYIYLGYSFIAVYFGAIVNLPKWTIKLTPFGLIPEYPVEEMTYPVLLVITLVAAALMVLGTIGYGKRDMKMQA